MHALSPLIREATALDAEAIARVRVASWQAAYRGIIDDTTLDAMSVPAGAERLLRAFDPAPSANFTRVVTDDAGRVIGFASAGPARGRFAPDCGELYVIYLLPAVQRQGLGFRLVRSMGRGLERRGFGAMVVWVLSRNAPARSFYERLGGRAVAERDTLVGHQRLPETAYLWEALRPRLTG